MKFETDEQGYYGEFGGAFIPEMLYSNVRNLQQQYKSILSDEQFKEELAVLWNDYVGRPSPLYFAKRLSKHYNTRIFLKREDLNHTGAHKINNTIGQILLAKKLGKTRIIAETGAGQHGVATATVCALMGMECIIYMGETDIKRQEPNIAKMKLLGAELRPVKSGGKTLKDATNEAIRDWISYPEATYYIIGSVVGPHPYPEIVRHFQSIISREVARQLKEKTGTSLPTAIIACIGGGSNAAGIFDHFLDQSEVRLIGVEAAGKGVYTDKTAAAILNGKPGIIHGSKTFLLQTDDGQITEPYSISAGLDYPGVGPLHAHLHRTGRVTYLQACDDEALSAAYRLMRLEGIIPALESAHAFAALDKMKFSDKDNIVICLSGRGDKDLITYTKHLKNEQDKRLI